MKRSVLTTAAAGLLCLSGLVQAHADSLNLTLSHPQAAGSPGQTLEFDATVAAPTGNTATIYLNGDTFTAPGLQVDDTPFAQFPFSLDPGQSFTGELFLVTVPAGTMSGGYTGSFQILGGADAGAQDVIANINFTTQVAATGSSVTPEPSSWLLFITGLAVCLPLIGRRFRTAGQASL